MGRADWRNDIRNAIAMERSVSPHGAVRSRLISIAYIFGILTGALLADDDAARETAEAVRIAEESGGEFKVCLQQWFLTRSILVKGFSFQVDSCQ